MATVADTIKVTVGDTIKEITREHLKNGGLALGQCLTAVGWVGGTVPELTEADGLVELSTADVAGGGIAVGVALAGCRPIYIVRYQGFQCLNSPFVVNYAAKSKDMWDIPCPMFIRSIGMDGGIGPSASGSHHGIVARMPGIVIAAPMTPNEYRAVWESFMQHDDPYYVSEHRKSFSVDYEIPDTLYPDAHITLFPISLTRLHTMEAVKILAGQGIVCNVINLLWLKPFVVTSEMIDSLKNSKVGGLVIDGDFENGIAKSLAFDLMHATDRKVSVLGLEEHAAGFAPQCDNTPPSVDRIVHRVKEILGKT